MNMNTKSHHKISFYQQWLSWERKQPILSFTLEFLFVSGIFLLLGMVLIAQLPIRIQWRQIPSYFWSKEAPGPFFWGLLQTLKLSAIALILTLIIGYLTALLRLSSVPSARLFAQTYILLIRNTPLLVQLYVGYFMLSPLFGLSSFLTALLVLSLFEGAYTGEIIRNAIENIKMSQNRAATALGLSHLQTQLLVIQPQAIRNALPVLANQGVSLIKDSALASAIGVFELSRSAQSIQEQTFLPFEPWLGVTVIYFTMTFALSIAVKSLEQKISQR